MSDTSPRAATGETRSPSRWRCSGRWDCSASIRTCRRRSRTTSRRPCSSATHLHADLSEEERYAWDQLDFFYKHGLAYAQEMGNRPQTLYALEDSPVGLAAWMLDHDARSLSLMARVFDGQAEGLSKDDILDNATLYWVRRTAVSSARLYWESKLAFFAPKGVDLPVGGQRLPRRDLRGPARLGRERVSQADPLQPAAQGRPLRRVGAAAVAFGGAASGVPLVALILAHRL